LVETNRLSFAVLVSQKKTITQPDAEYFQTVIIARVFM